MQRALLQCAMKHYFLTAFLASASVALPAQLERPAEGGWRTVDQDRPQSAEAPPTNPPRPFELIVPAGTWIKIRVDQQLSSDHNRSGDTFLATLTQPIVADGHVVARRGQTVEGRVPEAVKAGRAKGTSRLALEVVEISLADGRQVPLRTQLIEYHGGTSVGRDLTTVGTVSGTGAAIGAAASGGSGAAIGALAGAAASAIGVLATRGRATVVYPEGELTFRTLAPLTINTERAAQAFQPVRQEDYEPRTTLQRRSPDRDRDRAWYPYPGWGGFGYPYSMWGPSFYYFSGPRWGRGRRGRW